MDQSWRQQLLSNNGNVGSTVISGTAAAAATTAAAAAAIAPGQPTTIILPPGSNPSNNATTGPVLVPLVLNNGGGTLLAANPSNNAPCLLVPSYGISEHHLQQQQQLVPAGAALQPSQSHLLGSLEIQNSLIARNQQQQLQQQYLATEIVRRQGLLAAQQQAELERANLLNSAVYLENLKKQNNERLQELQNLKIENQNMMIIQNQQRQVQPSQQQPPQIVANVYGGAATAATTIGNTYLTGGGLLLPPKQPIISSPAVMLTTPGVAAATTTTSSTSAANAFATSKSDDNVGRTTAVSGPEPDAVPSAPTDKITIEMSAPTDDDNLSLYQCMLRKQIFFFEASRADIAVSSSRTACKKKTNAKKLKQVGVQCKFCAVMPPSKRGRGSTFYPGSLAGIYQASQNMAMTHFTENCPNIPASVKKELKILRQFRVKSSPVCGGKDYWVETAKKAGIYEKRDDVEPLPPAVDNNNGKSVVGAESTGTGISRLFYSKPEEQPGEG